MAKTAAARKRDSRAGKKGKCPICGVNDPKPGLAPRTGKLYANCEPCIKKRSSAAGPLPPLRRRITVDEARAVIEAALESDDPAMALRDAINKILGRGLDVT